MKKLALVAVALAFAIPAFAKGHDKPKTPPPTTIAVTVGGIDTSSSFANANSGFNSVSGKIDTKGKDKDKGGSSSVTTGAATASSAAFSDMNTVTVKGGSSNVYVSAGGFDSTLSIAGSNSGFNGVTGAGSVSSGAAGAHSFVGSSMNTVVVN